MIFPHQIHFVDRVEAQPVRMMHLESSDVPFFTRKLLIRHREGRRVHTEEIWLNAESIEELQVNEPAEVNHSQGVGPDPFA